MKQQEKRECERCGRWVRAGALYDDHGVDVRAVGEGWRAQRVCRHCLDEGRKARREGRQLPPARPANDTKTATAASSAPRRMQLEMFAPDPETRR